MRYFISVEIPEADGMSRHIHVGVDQNPTLPPIRRAGFTPPPATKYQATQRRRARQRSSPVFLSKFDELLNMPHAPPSICVLFRLFLAVFKCSEKRRD